MVGSWFDVDFEQKNAKVAKDEVGWTRFWDGLQSQAPEKRAHEKILISLVADIIPLRFSKETNDFFLRLETSASRRKQQPDAFPK